MCLVVKKGTEKQILAEDLVVYKLVSRIYSLDTEQCVRSLYVNWFEYVKDRLYQTDIKLEMNDHSRFDSIAGSQFRELLEINNIRIWSYRNLKQLQTVLDFYGSGFHFATTRERLTDHVDFNIDGVYKFIIPAGSEVIYDESGLGVANQIIFKGE